MTTEVDMTANALDNGTPTTADTDPAWTHFTLVRCSPSYWRVTFNHPPINTITATTVTELAQLVDLIEGDPQLNVVVFDSANPDYFLAHYDVEGEPARTLSMPNGPTGMHPWLDLTTRLARASAVSVEPPRSSARRRQRVRTRVRLTIRIPREQPLGQFEVGSGVVPGGGPMARLSRWSGAAACWRSCSWPTTSTGHEPRSTATSTASSTTITLTPKLTASRDGSRRSSTKQSPARSLTSTP